VKLTRRLAERAEIAQGARVLDVGCGLGGSSLLLARDLGCSVTGITISPAQAQLATKAAEDGALTDRVRFLVMNANQLEFPPESFDVVWVIECSEHLGDKEVFFKSCGKVLKPGGRLALCAWLTGDCRSAESKQLVADVCRGMLCPSLANLEDYTRWIAAAGLSDIEAEDITRQVERTWKYCGMIAERRETQALLRLMSERVREFVQAFAAIHRAYQTGAMAYGMFTARKMAS
jgi:tocopherol O-methyltransferase